MKITNCGYDYRHPADFKIYRPHGSGDYVLLVLRSPAFFVLPDCERITKSNSVILLKKGTIQHYGGYLEEFVNDWVHFEMDENDILWFEKLGLCFDKILEFESVSALSAIIRNMFREKYSGNINAEESALLYFRLLFTKISDLYNKNSQPNNSALFEQLSKIRQDVFSKPQKKWNVSELCQELSISPSYFEHQYKNFFGTTFKKDVTASRLEYSKYLLFSTDYSVSTISKMCGYENDVHFMRVFKQNTNITPSQYRKQSNYSLDKTNESRNYSPFSLKD